MLDIDVAGQIQGALNEQKARDLSIMNIAFWRCTDYHITVTPADVKPKQCTYGLEGVRRCPNTILLRIRLDDV